MIVNFACYKTQTLFITGNTRHFSSIKKVAERKLLQLDNAITLEDLRSAPGNHLEALFGDREGQHSIRINDQWRICFMWSKHPTIPSTTILKNTR